MAIGPTGPRSGDSQIVRQLRNRETRRDVLANIATRIKDHSLPIEVLYHIGHTYSALAIERGALEDAAVVLSQAAKGKFPYWFNKYGRVYDGSVDPAAIRVEVNNYNLPFFLGLSLSVKRNDWEKLVGLIEKQNLSLGGVLKNIGTVTMAVERLVVLEHPLLKQTVDSGLFDPPSRPTNPPSLLSPAGSPRIPSVTPARPAGPPPIPAKSK
jgi:hypothetical protein